MKWVLILLIFNGSGAPGIVQQEFSSARACQDAKVVMVTSPPVSALTYGYCFPL